MVRKLALPTLALGMLAFAVQHVVRTRPLPPRMDLAVPPPQAPFGQVVAGAGLVEAQTENIAVGSPHSGVVTEVLVRVGQQVGKGQILFRLDERALRAEWRVRQAALSQAQAQLDRLRRLPRKEEIPPLEAKVREAQANLADQEDQASRARRLYATRALGKEDHHRREQAAQRAREQLRKAEADLALLREGAWQPDLAVAEAAVAHAQALLRQAETELDRLEVRALVAGEVLQVNVRPGEFVGAPPGQALVVLGNVRSLHVRVDVDEADIPRLRPGAAARACLRGAPEEEFALRFVRVEPYVIPKKSLTGENTERVDTRVLQVVYALEGSARRIYVGQQLDVYIDCPDLAATTAPAPPRRGTGPASASGEKGRSR
jgi:multidrug resistance efflux pump